MAQPANNPKIEELRFKVRTDPKSRLFYPLAEELRKVGKFGEAEEVLRAGLALHPTYLSAWVGLGRILREEKKDRDAIEALLKALQVDPGNVVAARLLADVYYDLGEKVESIKKYKLVHALLPSDQEVQAMIEKLDRELNPIEPSPFAVSEEAPPTAKRAAMPAAEPPRAGPAPTPPPVADSAMPLWSETERVFDDTASSLLRAQMREKRTGDAEPMRASHSESPFEEPAADAGYGSDAFSVEHPEGMHVERVPNAPEVAEPWSQSPAPSLTPPPLSAPLLSVPPIADDSAPEALDEADVFAPTEAAAEPEAGDVTNTLTMADLYARQGLHDDARRIYDSILEREPGNSSVRAKRDALAAGSTAPAGRDLKVDKLERWLKKVSRKEAGGV
ncbi:MAG: tetratricopeptide repeat protein [Thermoanaerobaculia bacterium]